MCDPISSDCGAADPVSINNVRVVGRNTGNITMLNEKVADILVAISKGNRFVTAIFFGDREKSVLFITDIVHKKPPYMEIVSNAETAGKIE